MWRLGRVSFPAVLLSVAITAGAGAQAPSGSAVPQPPVATAPAATPAPTTVEPAATLPRYLVYFD